MLARMGHRLEHATLHRAMAQLFDIPKPVASFEPSVTGKVFSFVKAETGNQFQIDLTSLGKFSPDAVDRTEATQTRCRRNLARFRKIVKFLGWWIYFWKVRILSAIVHFKYDENMFIEEGFGTSRQYYTY